MTIDKGLASMHGVANKKHLSVGGDSCSKYN